MKKIILTLTLLVLIAVLFACKSTDPESTAAASNGNNPSSADGNRQFTMPPVTKWMLGTVKLEETDYAVGAEQAAELLPLWKALRTLSESDTAAQTEIDALITQIGESMTPEQISAIEAMNLTMQDLPGVMETLGIDTGNFGDRFGSGTITPEMQATMEAARANGQFRGGPGGDFPGDGPGGDFQGGGPGGGFGGGEVDPSVRETAIAERGGTRGAGFGMNSAMLDGIITFLEAKIQ